ncbi:MAG: DUF1345 domain-containing protein [Chitinophagaceae bacterium]
MSVGKTNHRNWLMQLRAVHRVVLCLSVAVAAYFLLPHLLPGRIGHFVMGWDIFALCMLVLSWVIFFTTDHHHIRRQAKDPEGSRGFIFVITLVSTFASLLAVLLLLTRQPDHRGKVLFLLVAVGALALSWFLIHTTFTYRYAHLFYADHPNDNTKDAEGLEFPKERRPDLLDFAYFSFVIGMTFQVSDVSITSSRIRQLALMHGLVSFAYNTAVIALTINIVAGLTNK